MDAWPEIRATRLEAARRQMDAAIRLLFAKEDALAVHTLAFAAYGLLRDLSKAAGESDTLRRLEDDARLRDGKEFWQDLNALANDLKHGEHEPTIMLRGVPEEFNEAALLIDCFLLRERDRLSSPEAQTMWLWHHALFFINIDDAPPEYDEWLTENWQQLHAETRAEKVEIGSLLLAALRSAPDRNHRMEPDQVLLPWRLVIRPSIGSRKTKP